MKKVNKIVFCLVVLLGLTVTRQPVLADESGSGQVSSTSKITFIAGDDEPTPVPDPKPKPAPKPTPKPAPSKIIQLPQTGEATNFYFYIGVAVLLVSIVGIKVRRGRTYEK